MMNVISSVKKQIEELLNTNDIRVQTVLVLNGLIPDAVALLD